jgi:hypothetical protein
MAFLEVNESMTKRSWIAELVLTFVVSFVVASVVTLLWNVIFHKATVVDWDTAFILALTVSAATTFSSRRRSK